MQSEGTATVSLQAKDSTGNSFGTGGATGIIIQVVGGTNSGVVGSTTDNGNGTYQATFTGKLVGTATLSATIQGNSITTTKPTITVTPGAIFTVTSGAVA